MGPAQRVVRRKSYGQHATESFPLAACLVALTLLGCGGRISADSSHASRDSTTGGTLGKSSGGNTSVSAGGASSAASGGTASTSSVTSSGGSCETIETPFPAEALCSSVAVEVKAQRANVLIVLDRSVSMLATPTGYTSSKWAAVVDALGRALSSTETRIGYGLLIYPDADWAVDSVCDVGQGVTVGVQPAMSAVPIIDYLLAKSTPNGEAPTAAALARALDYFTLGEGAALEGTKSVMLVTDSGPDCNASLNCDAASCTIDIELAAAGNFSTFSNCDPERVTLGSGLSARIFCLDDAAVLRQIEALRAAGISLSVVALPGTEPYAAVFDEFAAAGGMLLRSRAHRYYEATKQSVLVDVFREVGSCSVPLIERPTDSWNIAVGLDCMGVPQRTDGEYNWRYVYETNSLIIDGARCDALRAGAFSRIDVLLGCFWDPTF